MLPDHLHLSARLSHASAKIFLSPLFPCSSVIILFPETCTITIACCTCDDEIRPMLVPPGFGFVTHCLEAVTLVKARCVAGCLVGTKAKASEWAFPLFYAGYLAENFPARSKALGNLILIIISLQVALGFVKVKLPIFLLFCSDCTERPSNFELWSLLGSPPSSLQPKRKVFSDWAFITSEKQAVVWFACHGLNTSSGNHLP